MSPRIAALQGSSSTNQDLLGALAASASAAGYRVAGVVQVSVAAERGCEGLALRDLATGEITAVSQDLGPGSAACNFDAGALADACGRVERAIAKGADLVVLSKFGKFEVARHGLTDAFHAAIWADVPVATAISFDALLAWELFAGPLAAFVPANAQSLDAWWSTMRASAA
jgi:nucleoside-triphosphatase THEP1